MKTWLLSTLTAALLASPLAAFAYPIQVTVNGQPVQFDQPPVEVGGRVLVPVRGVFEGLGASVSWNASTRTVTAIRGQSLIVLPLGSSMAQVDGQSRMLDQPAQIIGGRTLVPLRFVSESLGAEVSWVPSQNLVAVTSGGGQPAYAPPQPSYPSYPSYQYPLVSSVTIDNAGPLFAGHDEHINLYGNPGGQATFTISGHRPEPMREVSPGHYVGDYTVRYNDNNPYAVVTGTLTMPDGEVQAINAPDTVAIFGFSHNPVRYYGEEPTIFREVTVPTTTVWLGDILRLSFMAPPGGTGFFNIGGQMVPAREQSPGMYVANYAPPQTVVPMAAPVMVSFQPRGQAAQQVILRQPVYVMGNTVPHGQLIASVSPAAPAAPGQPVVVQMVAAPGAQASFNLGSQQNIPMREVSPGHYEGRFTPAPGQSVSNAQVTARVALPHGPSASLAAPRTVSIAAPAPHPAVPNPLTPAPARPTPVAVAPVRPTPAPARPTPVPIAPVRPTPAPARPTPVAIAPARPTPAPARPTPVAIAPARPTPAPVAVVPPARPTPPPVRPTPAPVAVVPPARPTPPPVQPTPPPRPVAVVPPVPRPAPLQLERVENNGRGAFHDGDTVTITAHGTPHAEAVVNVGGQNVPMRETAPGLYEASFKVPPHARSEQSKVRVTLRSGTEIRAIDGAPIIIEARH